jgi:hypothetical protein
MIAHPTEEQEAPKHTPGILSHHHFNAFEDDGTGALHQSGNMKRSIFARWHDDKERRFTQVIAEVHEQAGHPEQAQANGDRFVECWNDHDALVAENTSLKHDLAEAIAALRACPYRTKQMTAILSKHGRN